MQRRNYCLHSAALLAALGFATGAKAQGFLDLEQTPQFVGLGLGSIPDYKGSDESRGGIAPYARYTFAGQQRYIQLFANEVTLNLVDSREFRFGPVLNYRFGRDDVDDKAVEHMEKIDNTVELGVFGDIAWIDPGNPRNRFILGATLLQDVGDESDGFNARLAARYWQQVHQAVDVHLGAGVIYGNNKFNKHYFGVNSKNVGTSGLPFFTADSGVNEYYATLGAAVYLSREWVVAGGVRWGRITGDAADSPIVDQRGDENQVSGGIGVAYIWR